MLVQKRLLQHPLSFSNALVVPKNSTCGTAGALLPANSCLVPAYQARGARVDTVESLDPQTLEPLLVHGATQCGACTPGVAMTACWILDHRDLLPFHTIRELMAGNLCRCTGYDGIVDAVATTIGEVGEGGTGKRESTAG